MPRKSPLPFGRAARVALALLLAPVGCVADYDDELVDDGDEEFRLAAPLEHGEPQTMLIRYWNGPTMRGSATLIAPNVVLTNAHAAWGAADGMYVQRGTQTVAGDDPIAVLQNLPHPDYSSPGDNNDLALLRLGCNITDIQPARINRTPLHSDDIGSSIKAVGYGPTTWGGTDWGDKRSMGDSLTGFNAFKLWVSGVSAASGDSGGSLYGYPLGIVDAGGDDGGASPEGPADGGDVEPGEEPEGPEGPDAPESPEEPGGEDTFEPDGAGAGGKKHAIYPLRKLIGVLTFASGTSIRVDAHHHWIDDVVDDWADPSLPPQPSARTITEASNSLWCPGYAIAGNYSIASPEAGVTYTWDATGAAISGSGTSVSVMPTSSAAYTLSVTATGPGGCARTFEATFGPNTSPCYN